MQGTRCRAALTSAGAWFATLAIFVVVACGGEAAASHPPTPAGQAFNMNPEPGVRADETVTVFAGVGTPTIEIRLSGLEGSNATYLLCGSLFFQ